MNTNAIMKRPMDDMTVYQRTKDNMFNATAFIQTWNEKAAHNPQLQHKEIADYFRLKQTEEFIKALRKEPEFSCGEVPYVKSRARADHGGGTWMHPLLFIDFCCWISPEVKVKVIRFVSDNMITFRKDAGDAYKELSQAVCSLPSNQKPQEMMSFVARAVNFLTFGQHYNVIRNDRGTEPMMMQLCKREQHITLLIKEGFITTFPQLQKYLRDTWKREHPAIPY